MTRQRLHPRVHDQGHPELPDLARSEVVMGVEFDTTGASPTESAVHEWLTQRAGSRPRLLGPDCGALDVTPERLRVSWGRQPHDGFASYDDIWPVFADDLENFEAFVRGQGLRHLPVEGCELTYVNPLAPGQDWRRRGVLERLLLQWAHVDPTETLLPTPEEVQSGTRYKIRGQDGAAVGRLYVTVDSVWLETPEPMILVTLTAHGRPVGEGTDGIRAFFDTGFEWIVRGFAALTSTEAQLPY
ncbi:MAG TPA: hypothetical protein DCQ30_08060 [Acidimicrobiaceae bacterium]|nr:hypothetical protein [Acidimicrobiaceae bacterium]